MLNGDELGLKIWNELKNIDVKSSGEEVWKRFGRVVIDYIKENSEVKVDVTTSSGAGTGVGKVE